MTQPRAELRPVAGDDIEIALNHYRQEAGSEVALDFVASLEDALEQLCRHPHIGSTRFAFDLDIPGLRSWPVKRFPYLIFYNFVDDSGVVDVWRVLHSSRDIPAYLQQPESR